MTLSDLRAALEALPPETPIHFTSQDGPAGPGYHVTELTHGSVHSIDCMGRESQWGEARMQILDGAQGKGLTAHKYAKILGQSLTAMPSLAEAPLTVEFAPRNQGLALHRLDEVSPDGMVHLAPRTAQCKPMSQAATGC